MSTIEIVPGRNERDETIFSVIVKRSYTIDEDGTVARSVPDQQLRKTDSYYDRGSPDFATVEHEHELAACKAATDVVVIGRACAPDGRPVHAITVGVRVGQREKRLRVTGDRTCRYRSDGPPEFSEPLPFTSMPIRYERAYGGCDEQSVPDIPFHYPRNPLGSGVVLRNVRDVVDGLALPNIEDPDDLLTPERVIIEEAERWPLQPLPAGFGWRQRNWYPRSALLGVLPPFLELGTVTREEQAGLLPRNHVALAKQMRLPTFEARFNNGASYGMIFRQLTPGEAVELTNFSPEPFPKFSLPSGIPEIFLDLGEGEQRLDARLHTLSICPDERSFDLVWGGALRYAGYQWLPKLKRLDARVLPE
jgi:hypothetical protein